MAFKHTHFVTGIIENLT